jgi:hypothetical protein
LSAWVTPFGAKVRAIALAEVSIDA